jgi:hypothetical protein
MDIPGYIEARIRQRPPAGIPVVRGATPVIAFGDVLTARVATLGLNPSKNEFVDCDGNELVGENRRLETLGSVGETDLASASANAVCRVFEACNNYFHRCPYRRWFDRFEPILKEANASYYDSSACHLDLVQWATDPVWRDLAHPDKIKLIESDVPFLSRQLLQENFRLLLLNGRSIMDAYEKRLEGRLVRSCIQSPGRLEICDGIDARGLRAVGWNINIQTGRA